MNETSVCLFIFKEKAPEIEGKLRNQFDLLIINSLNKLRFVLKSKHIFCILLKCSVWQWEDIHVIRKICVTGSGVPCVIYGKVSEVEFIFELAKVGVKKYISYGNYPTLLETLRQLKSQAEFNIELGDLIHSNQVKDYWIRKFYNFILKDFNFLRYNSIAEIANCLKIRPITLFYHFKQFWLSPKQLLLYLKSLYAAYLLNTTLWPVKLIAERSGFYDQYVFSKNFKKITGLAPKDFRKEKHWTHLLNFPAGIDKSTKKSQYQRLVKQNDKR